MAQRVPVSIAKDSTVGPDAKSENGLLIVPKGIIVVDSKLVLRSQRKEFVPVNVTFRIRVVSTATMFCGD